MRYGYNLPLGFLRELDEAPGGNNLHYILQCLRVPTLVARVWTRKVYWVATECSRNDGSKTQYYIVILDRLQGRSGALKWALESQIRGALTGPRWLEYNNNIFFIPTFTVALLLDASYFARVFILSLLNAW